MTGRRALTQIIRRGARWIIRCGAALALVGVTMGAAAALAAPPPAARLTPQDRQDLSRVQDYLNHITSLQSRFEQVAGDGQTATGTIYLRRPGDMRIVYDPPAAILIVASNGQIHYYDKTLKQSSQTATEDTPAWFLLRNDIHLNGDVTVTRLARDPGTLRITMVQTKAPDQGDVTLVLSETPLQLRQWTVVDAQRKTVTVTLDDPHYGVTLNPQLFYWSEPQQPLFGK